MIYCVIQTLRLIWSKLMVKMLLFIGNFKVKLIKVKLQTEGRLLLRSHMLFAVGISHVAVLNYYRPHTYVRWEVMFSQVCVCSGGYPVSVKGKFFDTRFGLIHIQAGENFFYQGTPPQ